MSANTFTGITMVPVAVLFVHIITSFVAEAKLNTESVGFDVIPREDRLVDLRGKFVLADAMFSDGNLTSYSAFFKDVPNDFKFQVWRPDGLLASTRSFILIHEHEASASSEGLYVEWAVTDGSVIAVKDGDRLGFTYTGIATCPLAATWGTDPTSLYMSSDSPSVSVGNAITFDAIQYPFEVSIQAEYFRDDRDMDNGPIIVGHTGATGATGRQGATGSTGPKGNQGPPGPRGSAGPKGTKGHIGPNGLVGEPGRTGGPGPTGATGARGETGASGATGLRGQKGDKGIKGQFGPRGPYGSTGATGYTGVSGPQGLKGVQGATGSTGRSGEMGATGRRGPQGQRGQPGPVGPKGNQGVVGGVGATGEIGATGERGPIYQDWNECETDTHGCEHNCHNEFGSYKCSCTKGYELRNDGMTCEDKNECEDYNGGCQKFCSNLLGTFKCSCPPGLTLAPNGLHCQDVLECAVNNGGCRDDEICVDTYGTYTCIHDDLPSAYYGFESQASSLNTEIPDGYIMLPLEDAELVNRDVIIGMIVWLILISVIVLSLLLCLCVRKIRESNEASAYAQPIGPRRHPKDRESMAFTNKEGDFY